VARGASAPTKGGEEWGHIVAAARVQLLKLFILYVILTLCTASMFSLAIAALKIHDVDDDDDDDKNGFIVIIVEGKDGGTVQ